MELLRVQFSALKRGAVERSLHLDDPEAELGPLPLPLTSLDVEFSVERDAAGGARARGMLRSNAKVECRRCLAPTPVSVEAKLDVLFRPAVDVTPGEEGVWALDREAGEVDLTELIREELWVTAPEYVECRPDCPGMCARCGVRLADEACDCPPPEPDPRWAGLTGRHG